MIDIEYAKELGAERLKLELGILLFRQRRLLHLTLKDMAGKLGIRPSYLRAIERADANPTIADIGRLFALLRLEVILKTRRLGEGE